MKMLRNKVSSVLLLLLLVAFFGKTYEQRIRLREIKDAARIFNGMDATEGEFPYYARLEIILSEEKLPDGRIRIQLADCGGSVIDNKHILTAAHCLKDNPMEIKVKLGIYDIDVDQNSEQKHYAESYEIHGGFNETTLDNDIAIVTLADEIEFTDDVKTIQLGCNYTPPDTQVQVAGRGITSNDGKDIPPRLEYADLVTISNDVCGRYYLYVVPTKICAWGGKTKGGTCHGDSGSALIQVVDGTEIQIGVVSGGDPNSCEIGAPDSFTRVSSFIDWIKERAQVTCSSKA